MRKKIVAMSLVCILLLLSCSNLFSGMNVKAADARFVDEYWYDQIDIVKDNREDAHAAFVPYQDVETALKNEESTFTKDPSVSDYYKLLSSDTEWRFHFSQTVAERLVNPHDTFEDGLGSDTGWDAGDWDIIKVPANWQTVHNDDGSFRYEPPTYINTIYPWRNTEAIVLGPVVTAPTVKNSVGHYQRTFTLEPGWEDRNTFISFQGVDSAFYVWVDGKYVGYAEDSFTASDFNLTPFLDPDKTTHTLSVQVYRWSTGSYLENQDMLDFGGIFRDVFLYSKDDIELRDFFITTDLDDTYTDAVLNLEASVRNLNKNDTSGVTVEADLYTVDGKARIWDEPLKIDVDEMAQGEEAVVYGSKEVNNPDLWYADTPNLYQLVIQVKQGGEVLETTSHRVGFREIGVRSINSANQQQITINGKKIVFRGVNRSEIDLKKGHAIEKEEIIQDMMLMKQFNVNAIRTSHYPNNPVTYELADELGIYICDEADIESHQGAQGNYHIPSGYPIWMNSAMDRTMNMVERDKNHPAIIIWSLGNEASYPQNGYKLDAEQYCMYRNSLYILDRDPGRIRKYERDNQYSMNADGTINREKSIVDVRSEQYPTVASTRSVIANTNNKLPYIWSEYAHSMGNGIGQFDEYWELVRNYENMQGGFIWDWIDQSHIMYLGIDEFYLATDSLHGISAPVNGELKDGMNGKKSLDGNIQLPVRNELKANSSQITLEAWVNPAELIGEDSTIISKGDTGYMLKISNRTKTIEFFVDGWNPGLVNAPLPDDFTDGDWKHLAGVYDNGKLSLYYNGELLKEGSTTIRPPADTNENPLCIGISHDYGRPFMGLVDSVGIYRKAMSAAEVSTVYNSKALYPAAAEDIVYQMDFSDETVKLATEEYDWDSYFGYGGDFGELHTDNDFCANGAVFADRTPKPALYQVRKTHQQVSFYDDGDVLDGKVRIVNEFLNTDLNEYNIDWVLKEDNTVLKEGRLEGFSLAPEDETTIELDLGEYDAKTGNDYLLEFSVSDPNETVWADAGYEIAFEQFVLDPKKTGVRPGIDGSEMDELETKAEDETIEISTDEFSITIDKQSGQITSYIIDGKETLEEGPKLNVYRAPTSNDTQGGITSLWSNFRNIGDTLVIDDDTVEVIEKEKFVQIIMEGKLTASSMNNSSQKLIYTVYGDGSVVISSTFTPNGSLGELPKMGMQLIVKAEYDQLEYYGRGPVENYQDRYSGQRLGVYTSTVEDQVEWKYIRPQENGNRTDVRWTSLTDESGSGLMISSTIPFETAVSQYEASEMTMKRHWYQVDKAAGNVWNIDLKNRGLGNNSCGGEGPWSQHRIQGNQTYEQVFRIVPVNKDTDKMQQSKVDVNAMYPIADILADGVSIGTFDPLKEEYTVSQLDRKNNKVPVISVELFDQNAEVDIKQAESFDDTAVISATSSLGVEVKYTITFELADQIYASDMPWAADVGGYFTNKRDTCSCHGESSSSVPISLLTDDGVQTFAKGIGSHATAYVDIDLEDAGVTHFYALVGINRCQTSVNANIIFRVFVDGVERYQSAEMKVGMPAEEINLDVTGAKRIRLYADENGSDGNDHGVWADARFTYEPSEEGITIDDLIKLINEAKELTEEEYKENSWNNLQYALEIAEKTVIDPEADSKKIEHAYNLLDLAMKLLVKKDQQNPYRRILEIMVEAADEAIDSGEVDAAEEQVQTDFYAAYTKATSLLSNAEEDEAEMKQAALDLLEQLHRLGFTADHKAFLRDLYETCLLIDLDDYEDGDSKDSFRTAMDEAWNVLQNMNASKEDIQSAYDNLLKAAMGLEKKKDRSLLEKALAIAEEYLKEGELDKYSDKGKEEFLNAYKLGKEVYISKDATEEEIRKAATDLMEAVAALRYKADKSLLKAAVGEIEALDLKEFTEASVSVFLKAYEEMKPEIKEMLEETWLTDEEQYLVDEVEVKVRQLARLLEPVGGVEPDSESDTESDSESESESETGAQSESETGDQSESPKDTDPEDPGQSGKETKDTSGQGGSGGKSGGGADGKAKVKTGDQSALYLCIVFCLISLGTVIVLKKEKKVK